MFSLPPHVEHPNQNIPKPALPPFYMFSAFPAFHPFPAQTSPREFRFGTKEAGAQ